MIQVRNLQALVFPQQFSAWIVSTRKKRFIPLGSEDSLVLLFLFFYYYFNLGKIK